MDRSQRIETTGGLKSVSRESLEELSAKRESLVKRLNEVMLARPDIMNLVGEENLEMMKDNHANHSRFMESVFTNFNAEVLVDTVLWVFRAYRTRGFSSAYWAAQLNNWIVLYSQTLTKSCFTEIYPFYTWMQIHIPEFVKLSDEKLEGNFPLH